MGILVYDDILVLVVLVGKGRHLYQILVVLNSYHRRVDRVDFFSLPS